MERAYNIMRADPAWFKPIDLAGHGPDNFPTGLAVRFLQFEAGLGATPFV